MQLPRSIPSKSSWGNSLYSGESSPEEAYSEDLFRRLRGTREKGVDKVIYQILDVRSAREVVALIAKHEITPSELREIFTLISEDNKVLRFPVEKITAQAQEIVQESYAEEPAAVDAVEDNSLHNGNEQTPAQKESRRIPPEFQPVVVEVEEYPGMHLYAVGNRLIINGVADDKSNSCKIVHNACLSGYVRRDKDDRIWPVDEAS